MASIEVLSMDNARLSIADINKDSAIKIQDLNGLFLRYNLTLNPYLEK